MLLGKRGRASMKRNTSMKEFTVDFTHLSSQPSDPPHRPTTTTALAHHHQRQAFFSHTNFRTNDYDDNFLRSCSLCKRLLISGHDIYMYRGDSAFCSLECREHQIIDDEKKEKFLLASTNGEPSTVTAL